MQALIPTPSRRPRPTLPALAAAALMELMANQAAQAQTTPSSPAASATQEATPLMDQVVITTRKRFEAAQTVPMRNG